VCSDMYLFVLLLLLDRKISCAALFVMYFLDSNSFYLHFLSELVEVKPGLVFVDISPLREKFSLP